MEKIELNVNLAEKYEVDVAVVIEILAKHKEGALLSELREEMPFYTFPQIRRILDRSMKEGLIIAENRNEHKVFRHLTYEVTDKARAMMRGDSV